jgi:hypothetical protein
MEKTIQLIQAVHAEASAVAWLVMGVLLIVGIVLGFVVLFWIRGGGLRAQSTQELLSHETAACPMAKRRQFMNRECLYDPPAANPREAVSTCGREKAIAYQFD